MADGLALPATGFTVDTDEVNSKHLQRVKRVAGGDGSASDYLDKSSLSNTYTGAGNGTTIDLATVFQAMSALSLQCKGTGATPTAWNVIAEVSLDGTNWTTVLTHANTSHFDGQMIAMTSPFPFLYARSRMVSVTLGSATNVVATLLCVPHAGGGEALVRNAHIVLASASTQAQSVKAAPGILRGLHIFNNDTSDFFVKLHNTAGTPTPGASVSMTFAAQAGTYTQIDIPGGGRAFPTGIGLTVTGAAADADTTVLGTLPGVVELFYE